jgi:uncharacterized protein (TIGR03000 family)
MAVLVLGLWATGAGAQVNPGMIRSGLGGFGYSPMAGSIGTGASYADMGYIFIPGVGLVAAYSPATLRFGRFRVGGRGYPELTEPVATITAELPSGATLRINGQTMKVRGTKYVYKSKRLRPRVDYDCMVRASWSEHGKEVTHTYQFKMFAGARRTVDFRRLAR